MKTLKITLMLVAVLFLTVSGVQSDNVVNENEPTFKEYNPTNLVAIDKKKLKLETQG
ncbi:MAG: hypothetical protein HKN40_04280 [Winogradskyella sp.]|uniref:hypothetical protein n=1 Tax=Winogradskyella sp. TaxID=1883156 RepID=UPI0017BBC484|nr:hypothetical protein [Winogradskyella sp.]